MNLNSCQRNAVSEFVDFLLNPTEKEMIISGKAGTGKSTLVEHLVNNSIPAHLKTLALITNQQTDYEIVLTATTNKAAKVLAEKMSTNIIRTIHSYIGLTVQNNFKTGDTFLKRSNNYKPFNHVILFIDEASFIDEFLLREIRQAAMADTKIVYIGDPYQLAPVKSGAKIPPVFTQPIREVRLETIMRNPGPIEHAADRFRVAVETAQFQPLLVDGQKIIHATGEEFKALVDDHFIGSQTSNNKILAWSNERVISYNNYIREARGFTEPLCVGEEVITNKPIMVGNVMIPTDTHLIIEEIIPTKAKDLNGYYVRFKDSLHLLFQPADWHEANRLSKAYARRKEWHEYFDIKERWLDLRPIYACTIHKSQGSTYDKAFIDLSDMGRCNISSEFARMMYVAVSRASNQVILYGDLPAKYSGE